MATVALRKASGASPLVRLPWLSMAKIRLVASGHGAHVHLRGGGFGGLSFAVIVQCYNILLYYWLLGELIALPWLSMAEVSALYP